MLWSNAIGGVIEEPIARIARVLLLGKLMLQENTQRLHMKQ